MKYTVTIHHYVVGSGYSHSESFDNGTAEELFTAQEYNERLDEPFSDNPDGWVDIEVNFYEDGSDPLFDDPISTDTYKI